MQVMIQNAPRCVWHTDCEKGRSGIIKTTDIHDHTLAECLDCGAKGRIEIGAPFNVCFTAGDLDRA